MPEALFPFQQVGADFLSKRAKGAIFDEMGLGKTAQAIRALDLIGARRVLIICPAAVREVWKGEFRKFAVLHRRILKGRDVHDLKLWLKHKADVLLLSYEMAVNWIEHLGGDLIDAVVFDEAHHLKTVGTKRVKALLGDHCTAGLLEWAVYCWFLTGTPNPNDAADIWSIMRAAGATELSRDAFAKRYYRQWQGAYTARHEPKREMLGELRMAIDSFAIRRTKRQAGLELPPIWITAMSVDGDTDEIRALLREHPDLEDAILDAVEKGGLSFLDAQHIATLRRLVGEAKAPAFTQLLIEELQNGLASAVVFGVHRRALQIVHSGVERAGIGSVLFDGSTSDANRTRAVRDFQSGAARVFVGNLRAAGTGLTLTATADVIMLEQDWAPAANAQALMRVHRIGQDRSVRAQFISLAGSIDETVAATVARKTAAIAMLEGAESALNRTDRDFQGRGEGLKIA